MNTGTQTKTVADIRRVLNSFAADFSMKAQSTGLWTRAEIEEAAEDLIAFASAGYIDAIVIILWDAAGKRLRGRKYIVSNSAIGWENDLPGNNLWPQTPGGSLQLIAVMSAEWWILTSDGQQNAKQRLAVKGAWPSKSVNVSFSGMTASRDRRYASNGFGLERWTYE